MTQPAMSLKAVYERFLSSPNPPSLSENASLHYVPTLRTFSQPGPVIRHLETQNRNEVRKKAEKVIAAVEGQNSLSLEVDTTLEFISSGGAYLPDLDNFVINKIATFPSVHIVNFDNESKIQRIRIYWDQGSLLRQVDVIGTRGKNWPITDGKDQVRLITSALAGTKVDTPVAGDGDMDNNAVAMRTVSPGKKRIQDPHASLALFTERDSEENTRKAQPAIIPPRASAKPRERDYSELFATGDEEYQSSKDVASSPQRSDAHRVIAPKGAGASKFKPSRLFEEDPSEVASTKFKANPAMYKHFELGGAEEQDHSQPTNPATAKDVPMRARTNKHLSQWDFEDFMTPEKPRNRVRGQDVRHFGWSDDESEKVEALAKQPKVGQPRRDVQAHFEFVDDGAPDLNQQRPAGRLKGNAHNTGLGLYQNNLYDDGTIDNKTGHEKEPLSSVTNNAGRSKDFDKHWAMSDTSPVTNNKVNNENRPLAGDRKKAIQTMDASWGLYDQSPEQNNKPAPSKPLRKGMESHWGFGDE